MTRPLPLGPITLHFIGAGAVLIAAACSDPVDLHTGFSISDSAGIRIAMNDTPVDLLKEVISTVPDRAVTVGVVSGAPDYMFNRIRDVARLESGHIVVIDETQQLRVFDSTGKHVVSHGGKGQGPGEFLSASDIVAQHGDSLLVWDDHAMRYSAFTVAGGFHERSATRRKLLSDLLIRDYYFEHMYPVPDGSLIVEVDPRVPIAEREAQRPVGEFTRLPSLLVWVNREFTEYRKLGEHGGLQQAKLMVAGTPQYFVSPNGYWPRQSVGGSPPRICIDAIGGPQVNCFDSDGSATYVRWHALPRLLSDETRKAWIEAEARRGERAGARADPPQIRAALVGAPLPQELASVVEVKVDKRGLVWVRSPDLPNDDRGQLRFRVFDRKGEILGYALAPSPAIEEIGEDYMLVISRNVDGVEQVVMYRLKRDLPPAR